MKRFIQQLLDANKHSDLKIIGVRKKAALHSTYEVEIFLTKTIAENFAKIWKQFNIQVSKAHRKPSNCDRFKGSSHKRA